MPIRLLVLLALTGTAAAQPSPPDVAWEFVGPDSIAVWDIGLLDSGDPFGLPTDPYAALRIASSRYENGVYRLVNPIGGPAAPDSGAAWTFTGFDFVVDALYADTSGLVLAAHGTGPRPFVRSGDFGATWDNVDTDDCDGSGVDSELHRTSGPGREGTLWLLSGPCRSDDAGWTWTKVLESAPEYLRQLAFAEVPASAALPAGRLLMGVGAGALYSDDGGRTFAASSLYGDAFWIVSGLAVAPDAGHPYGAAVYAAALGPRSRGGDVYVFASDDGGITWERRSALVQADYGFDRPDLAGEPEVVALGDGSLVLAVRRVEGGPFGRDRGAVLWSGDGGRTWSPLGGLAPWSGERPPTGACGSAPSACPGGVWPGWGASTLAVDASGRVWAGTDNGVWRTTGPAWAVAGEPAPAPKSLSVAVFPNPTAGGATVEVSQAARIVVVDALGREVAVWDGARRVEVDTSGWAPGAYVVRAVSASGARATAGLAVAR
ncbi:T9SS type A sorting domain-containing protein [Rubrivirga sp. IMCC45206]|uniref:T9SS type A sorting domain-containing protein n=1 Tax=Rubrivirga sp. IMCC45206 TaxID=3391614 RepID=UPI00399000DC